MQLSLQAVDNSWLTGTGLYYGDSCRKGGLVDAQTGNTKRTFADIQKLLDDATAGSKENPLRIFEASVAGASAFECVLGT